MKYLHTIICTADSTHHNARCEFTRTLIRNRKLTERGCERILKRGDDTGREWPATGVVVRVETVIYAR